MQPEHRAELDSLHRSPREKVVYALGMLSDIVDGNMVGEQRDIHINDAKEIIIGQMEDLPGAGRVSLRQEEITIQGTRYYVTHIPTATSGGWYVVQDACEIWGAVAIDLDGTIIGWREPPKEEIRAEVEEAIKKAFGIPEEP